MKSVFRSQVVVERHQFEVLQDNSAMPVHDAFRQSSRSGGVHDPERVIEGDAMGPGQAGSRHAVALRGGATCHLLRCRRSLFQLVSEGGHRTRARIKPRAAALDWVDRLAVVSGHRAMAVRVDRQQRLGSLGFRRNRHRERVRGRQSHAAHISWRDAVPVPGRAGRGVE